MSEKEKYWAKLYFYQKLKERAEKLLDRFNKIFDFLEKSPQGIGLTKKEYFIYHNKLEQIHREANALVDSYNSERYDTEQMLNISLPIIVSENSGEMLQRLISRSEKVIGVIKSKISPLTAEQEMKLEPIKKELESILPNLDLAYEKNMNEAIKECEQGHFLASVMITSRVIQYILDQIEGKTIEEKNKFLKEKGIIDKKDRGEITTDFIQKADKKARNYFSHNINAFASPSDSTELLSACVKLLKVINYLNEKK